MSLRQHRFEGGSLYLPNYIYRTDTDKVERVFAVGFIDNVFSGNHERDYVDLVESRERLLIAHNIDLRGSGCLLLAVSGKEWPIYIASPDENAASALAVVMSSQMVELHRICGYTTSGTISSAEDYRHGLNVYIAPIAPALIEA